MRGLLGSEIGVIFPDPLSSMHPFSAMGVQLSKAYLVLN